MHKEVILCDCYSSEHQYLVLSDEEFVYIQPHLIRRSFWYRLKYGVKYIFGYKSKYGAWDEMLLSKSHYEQFQRLADTIKNLKQ